MNTTTSTQTTAQHAAWILDTEAYVAHGAFGTDSREWADEFRALGGQSCGITFPAHIYGDHAPDAPVMHVVGTPAALAFVEATVTA